MYNLCVFAGTTEGRELIEFLSDQPVAVTACVATEYGETLLHGTEHLKISSVRMTADDMVEAFQKQHFDLVVDATHPYATMVTENIAAACEATHTPYLRLLRDGSHAPSDAVFMPDIASAVDYLNATQGNVLLTTGSKELGAYCGMQHFKERVYARVLPMEDSLRLCQEAGLPPAHILAMQGPFSQEMNTAMLRAVSAKYMVTKDSGEKGGFDQKIAAAREAGAALVVIGRPPQREGISYANVLKTLCERFDLRVKPQVTMVGIGPGSEETMTQAVRSAVDQADCLIGAKRMLESVVSSCKDTVNAISPVDISHYIHTHPQHRKFVVVMSGDVGFFSGAKKLLPMLSDCTVKLLPGISSLVYLCAKLGTSYEDVVPVSIHGRDHNILSDIRLHSRVFTLVGGENGMGKLCQELVQAGLGSVRLSVGERLSYANEKITIGTAEALSKCEFDGLSVALIENGDANWVVTHGLPDERFQRGAGAEGLVPMTKSEVRSVCLSKLQLKADSVCWDVGAGTGSVAVEMAMQARGGQVYAIEKKEAALDLIRENGRKFGADHLVVVPGLAPEACKQLPAPTHAFIGGSSGNMKEIIALLLEKNPKVRIVATAIALESIAELTCCLKAFPFTETEIVSMSVARNRKAGNYQLMAGQNPVYIFTMQAGGDRP